MGAQTREQGYQQRTSADTVSIGAHGGGEGDSLARVTHGLGRVLVVDDDEVIRQLNSSPGAGAAQTLRSTGALDVTVDNLRPQIECICYGAITATRAVLPAMLTAGTGTLLYTTGASSVTPAPVFVSAGMAGAALRKWALTLNGALAGMGVYAGHVAIGTWIAGTPGVPEGAPLKEPDDLAHLYWDLHTDREPAERLISA
jgi:hypothetical protein